MRIGAALWLAVLSGCASGAAGSDWALIASQLEIMRDCPERVWPGYRWQRGQLVFYARTERTAHIFRLADQPDGEPQRAELRYGELPPGMTSGSYATGDLAGRPTLFISLDDAAADEAKQRALGYEPTVPYALVLAFHEAFHTFGQGDGWISPAASRASDFPFDDRPRYLRLMLLRSLQAAIRGEQSLGAAAYWYEQYRTQFASEQESVLTLDVREGAAKYVEVVSSWLAREGCGLSDAELSAVAAREIDVVAGYIPRMSGESYPLGAAAGVLLRASGRKGWEQRVAAGEPPVALLLDGVVPERQPDDAVRVERIRELFAQTNAVLARMLEPFVAAYSAPGQVRVALPYAWSDGASTVEEAVRMSALPGTPVVWPKFTASFGAAQGARIDVDGLTALDAEASPCGPAVGFVLPASAIHDDGAGRFQISAAGVSTAGVPAELHDADGVRWLCVGGRSAQR